MQYFQKFPPINYTLTEINASGNAERITRVIPNMTVKLLLEAITKESVQFETYKIKDKDRPDTVSAQFYGSSEYAWILFLANNMRDWYDWPLNEQEFYDYVNTRYETSPGAKNGIEISSTTIDAHEWQVTTGNTTQIITLSDTFGGIPRNVIGVVTTVIGSNVITGSGTTFNADMVGDIIYVGNTQSTMSEFTFITSVTNSTSINVLTKFTKTLYNNTYSIITNYPNTLDLSQVTRTTVYEKELKAVDVKREIKIISLESLSILLEKLKEVLAK